MTFSLAKQGLTRMIAASLSMSSVRNSSSTGSISRVTVIGAGLMGSGIAQVAAQTGHTVVLSDISEDLLQKSSVNIQKSLERVAKKQFASDPELAKRFVKTTLDRLTTTTSAEDAVKEADIVVEAIVENIPIKHKLYSAIDKAAPPGAIFASNTSSLSITELASVTRRKEKFGGLHFFNPVPMMKLVEVIRTSDTSEETYKALMEFGKTLKKTPITCKDTPGFVVNRLLVPYMGEAVRMYERGDATSRDIDTAMKLGAGYPMGPFELADYVGLDTIKFIIDGWHQKFPDIPLFNPIPTVNQLVAEGKLGIKSGEGFYKYEKK